MYGWGGGGVWGAGAGDGLGGKGAVITIFKKDLLVFLINLYDIQWYNKRKHWWGEKTLVNILILPFLFCLFGNG